MGDARIFIRCGTDEWLLWTGQGFYRGAPRNGMCGVFCGEPAHSRVVFAGSPEHCVEVMRQLVYALIVRQPVPTLAPDPNRMISVERNPDGSPRVDVVYA